MGLDGGLHSPDDFRNLTGTSLSQNLFLTKFFMKIQSVVIILLVVDGGLRSVDNFQNLVDCSLYCPRHFQKISSKYIHNFLSNLPNRKIDKQTNKQHSESANLDQGQGSLPKLNGLLLVPSSIFPENFMEIHL